VARFASTRTGFALTERVKRFLGVALVLLLALGGGFWWIQSQRAPRVHVTPLASLPPQEQQKRRAQAQKAVEQVKAIARDAKSGESKDFTLQLTQDQLNTLVQDRLKTTNVPLRNPRVGLQNGQLIFEGDGNYKGIEAPVSASGTVTAQDGDVAFEIDSLTLGGLPAPSQLKEKAQSVVSDGLKKALREKGSAKIESVEIGDGILTIKGTTGKAAP